MLKLMMARRQRGGVDQRKVQRLAGIRLDKVSALCAEAFWLRC